jgi:ABC-type sugar transport system ATPase subunit
MNLVSGVLQEQDGQPVVVRPGNVRLTCGKGRYANPVMERNQGKSVVAGIRPSHLSLWELKGKNTIQGSVDMVELIGEMQHIHFHCGDTPWVATVDVSKNVPDRICQYSVLPEQIMLFNEKGINFHYLH